MFGQKTLYCNIYKNRSNTTIWRLYECNEYKKKRTCRISHISLAVFAPRYSAQANMMNHKCECCREKRVSEKQVELTCADGTKIQHSYKVIDECQCVPTECEVQPTSQPARRRRR